MTKILLLLCLITGCSHKNEKAREITVFKQWHLSPTAMTLDIEASKKLPQYENQKDIYLTLVKMIEEHHKILLLVEGCELGVEIDEKFLIPYNGWTFSKLMAVKSNSNYEDILTLLPLKIKVKYPDQVTALCADNEDYMKHTQLALSDTRGYLGFYLRLKESKANPKRFSGYKEALEETLNQKISDPIGTSKTKAIESLERFNSYVNKRNEVFTTQMVTLRDQNPILIIGGLHANGLVDDLEKNKLKYRIVTPKGYPNASEKLAQDLAKAMKE